MLISPVIIGPELLYYNTDVDTIGRFCKGLNPEQARITLVFVIYAQRWAETKFNRAEAASDEREKWRKEVTRLVAYRSALTVLIGHPQVIVPA